jgi:hypothetical protein
LIEIKYNAPIYRAVSISGLDQHLPHPTSRFQGTPSRARAQIPDPLD